MSLSLLPAVPKIAVWCTLSNSSRPNEFHVHHVRQHKIHSAYVSRQFRTPLVLSKLFHKVMGDVDSYLDPKKMPGRLKWSEDSHKRLYENDWVVDILPGNGEYDLGYDYHECGACKLCKDEGCPVLTSFMFIMSASTKSILHM